MMLSTKNFTQEQIKDINRVNIINFIRQEKTTTKQEIALTLDLSIPTITSNINDLINEGYVKEVGIAKSTGGRKPVILGFVKNAKYSFGVSITKDHVQIRLINLENDIIDETEFPYTDLVTTLSSIKDHITNMLKEHAINRKYVVGIGLALPGVVNDEHLILEKAPNLQVHDFSFIRFQESLGLRVWIENEANIAAFAEIKVGNSKNIDNLVYISITEGIGTGIIYKSNQKKAGEFGHTRVSGGQLRCNCGRSGCWELYASKQALLRLYNEVSDIETTSIDQIFDSYDHGDSLAKAALLEYANYLFDGVENIILGLNPDYVVIGGEFGKYERILKQVLRASDRFKTDRLVYEGSEIIFTGLEDKGALTGAALLPLEVIFNYNSNVI
jgi:predicted NBD/HSP70 family sugar kinase